MIVKEYTQDNFNDLHYLMNQWSEMFVYDEDELKESIKLMQQNTNNKLFIAENDDGKAVGYIFTGLCYYIGWEPFVEVIQLLVDKDNRSKGVGEKLIKHICTYYKKQGIYQVRLSSRIEREKAHEFYEKLGFKEYKRSIFFEKDI